MSMAVMLDLVLGCVRIAGLAILVLAVLGMRRDIRRAIGRHKP